MKIHINLNDWVKVKITDYGKELYKKSFEPYSEILEAPELRVDDDGYSRFKLWEFMNIFGPFMYVGAKNVIDPLEIVKEFKE